MSGKPSGLEGGSFVSEQPSSQPDRPQTSDDIIDDLALMVQFQRAEISRKYGGGGSKDSRHDIWGGYSGGM